ncbi:MAG: S41 family peptidase [Anaerolineae bacterium]|nr:S41 family peptidase [Anaerolineae bacterium]
MTRRAFYPTLFLLYSVALLAAGFWMGQRGWPLRQLGIPTASLPPDDAEVLSPFIEVWNLANERFYEQPIDQEAAVQGAINGMLATLDDPHTRYLPPDVEAAARDQIEGELEGIGVIVEEVDGNITVVSPFEGSPAEAAGLETGDILRAADGVELTGLGLDAAARLIRGPAGTSVHLLVERDGSTFEVDVVRDIIDVPSVRGEMLPEDVAYVRLSRFTNRTPDELDTILNELLSQEPSSLILDLRGNPGGGLSTAVDVADQFLDSGIVLTERFGTGQDKVYRSRSGEVAENIAMVVLIDEGSASASEVLAGALRDRGRATLIGTTSFGKGTVQVWHSLSNGGGVRITVARWLTPDGDWVDQGGIEPQERVALPESSEPFVDTQLDAAVAFLTNSAASAGP